MSATLQKPFKPLVVGAPRSGFALLSSVLIHFVPLGPSKADLKQTILNILIEKLGDHVSSAIVKSFATLGITKDLLYNPNFRLMIGGPKWLSKTRPGFACFRKYIGVRDMGDFTLITSHPKEVLDAYEVIHSHSDPGWWADHHDYADYIKYASVRNPIGIINSSVFSLNALASEYIQKFVPPEQDNDLIRRQLALYKFTDLNFMEGLIQFLVGYLEDFVKHKDKYHLMKWEDLILNPIPTILNLARAGQVPVSEEFATQMWAKIDHVNLTGNHRHNYRRGKGIVGDWMHSIINEHLDMMKDFGLEPLMVELGYDPITHLDEKDYTPFQKEVSNYIRRGRIYRNFPDADLFNFAFNKSNLISDKFPFRRYEWREWTQIERSNFTDEVVEKSIWDVAETAAGQINELISDFLSGEYSERNTALRSLRWLRQKHEMELGGEMGQGYGEAFSAAEAVVEAAFRLPGAEGDLSTVYSPPVFICNQDEPHLVRSFHNYNIVYYQGLYFGLPQRLGDVRLERDDILNVPGILKSNTMEEITASVQAAADSIEPKEQEK